MQSTLSLKIPSWVRLLPHATVSDAALMSGAALCAMHHVMGCQEVPHPLLRARLALHAAEACVVRSGRPERARDLRDEVHLLRPGEQPGPAGAVYLMWQRAVERKISAANLHRAAPAYSAEQIAIWLGVGRGTPIDQAAQVLETVLAQAPRAEDAALMLADAALARALGWGHVVPLLAIGMRARDLRKTSEALRLGVHKAVMTSAQKSVPMAADLVTRVDRLYAVAPRLRSKVSDRAVELFATRDALAPSVALTGFMTDRSARRLCERLLDLGAVREVTGRETFRLYAV